MVQNVAARDLKGAQTHEHITRFTVFLLYRNDFKVFFLVFKFLKVLAPSYHAKVWWTGIRHSHS